MPDNVIEDIASQLVEMRVIAPQDFAGCSENQIIEAMEAQNVAFLPAIYQNLLLKMGKRGFDVMMGADCSCQYLNHLKDICNDGDIEIPQDAFVFAAHQGYTYWYFQTASKQEEPPVFGVSVDEGFVIKITDTFTDFLYLLLDEGA